MTLQELQGAISDEFWESGACSASCVRDCRHGITFFGGDFFEPGELEELEAKAKKQPERYVSLQYSPNFTHILGVEWCWSCQKCLDEALHYQTVLWNNRHFLMEFIFKRAKKNLEAATSDANLAMKVAGVLEAEGSPSEIPSREA